MDEVNTSIEHEGNKLFAADDSSSSTASSAVVRWQPKQITFRPYVSTHDDDVRANSQPLRVVVKRPLVSKLTKDIVDTYQICNSEFRFLSDLNPKRFLTTPSNGVLNDGHDNANSDLILSVNYALVNKDANRRYIVKDILGHGTFGQVVKCWVADMNAFIAVKVIKNQPAYYQQALVEVSILTTLNRKFDPEDKHHIVRIYEYFVCQRHLCIAFELLETNLYELIKLNQFRGLSLTIVQLFSKQILRGLTLMKDAGIIHCDLKPENILLCSSSKPAEIKIIDFGSACIEDRTVYSYIQSRYYRSPEVVLGYHYTTAIDMWSFGCIVAELFLGLPLFPGSSEFDLLRRMIKIIGGQPPDYMLKEAKNTSKFFKYARSVNHEESGANPLHRSRVYEVLTEEDYEARDTRKPAIGKEYFNHKNLEAIVRTYPYKKNLPQEELIKESQMRLALVDFLRGLVEFDPAKRWSPLQASKHPFLTGEPFTSPYKPAPETPSVPVSHNAKVNHHPAGGHWFAAGLSPNISSQNRRGMQNSPRFQVMPPYAHAAGGGGSYGSLGSHGSYNDGGVLGSSYGSYGDNTNLLAFCSPVGPSGMNMYPQNNGMLLGSSPDTRRIMQQLPHSNGLGMSPGNYMPMSLGSSPSQYTPTGGHYGPASPAARGSCHGLGSPLGKGHYNNNNNFNRRKSGPTNYSATTTGSSTRGSFVQFQNSRDKPEPSNSVPDPADWDPNYSVELLLQEDNSDASASTVTNDLKAMNLSQGSDTVEPVRRYNHLQNSSPSMSMQRPPNGHIQAYSSHGEAGTSPRTSHSHPLSVPSHMKPHNMGQGSNRLPLYPPAQRFNHGRSQAQWDPNRVHASLPSYQSGVPHYSAATNGTPPQGRRGNNYPPVGILPPVSRGRKDNGGGNSSN